VVNLNGAILKILRLDKVRKWDKKKVEGFSGVFGDFRDF